MAEPATQGRGRGALGEWQCPAAAQASPFCGLACHITPLRGRVSEARDERQGGPSPWRLEAGDHEELENEWPSASTWGPRLRRTPRGAPGSPCVRWRAPQCLRVRGSGTAQLGPPTLRLSQDWAELLAGMKTARVCAGWDPGSPTWLLAGFSSSGAVRLMASVSHEPLLAGGLTRFLSPWLPPWGS